jgi:hypothetical protein
MRMSKTFHDDLRRYDRSLRLYAWRHYLSRYPKDLLRWWLKTEGAMPTSVAGCAFKAWKTGAPPKRALFKGSPCFPKLSVIQGGKT